MKLAKIDLIWPASHRRTIPIVYQMSTLFLILPRAIDPSRGWLNEVVFTGTTTSAMLCFSNRARKSLFLVPLKVSDTIMAFYESGSFISFVTFSVYGMMTVVSSFLVVSVFDQSL